MLHTCNGVYWTVIVIKSGLYVHVFNSDEKLECENRLLVSNSTLTSKWSTGNNKEKRFLNVGVRQKVFYLLCPPLCRYFSMDKDVLFNLISRKHKLMNSLWHHVSTKWPGESGHRIRYSQWTWKHGVCVFFKAMSPSADVCTYITHASVSLF